uniref:Uncharacterized protein n=1 Tax=Molossus molossus TaxID=27622 RepID=A0A7J8BN26_MOLMO|nr:hypothetical protein HJG59_010120 [Molossus molossus]
MCFQFQLTINIILVSGVQQTLCLSVNRVGFTPDYVQNPAPLGHCRGEPTASVRNDPSRVLRQRRLILTVLEVGSPTWLSQAKLEVTRGTAFLPEAPGESWPLSLQLPQTTCLAQLMVKSLSRFHF